ncbi:MAG: 50S ribosomal protein L9 [Candidatus Dependentiae bacterium ADurb.Bin331]|nr:MAG: 50S ribosomal protein L9 [Candidatus Dependentiae bacterium ADurb.Bin331]
MKVYLLKNVEKIGVAGEIISVADGYGANYLIPLKLGVQITPENLAFYEKKKKTIEHRKEVIATETSMLADKIKNTQITLKRKMANGHKLFGSVSDKEIAELLAQKDIHVSKNQVIFDKRITEKGNYEITVKLSNRLQPKIKLTVTPEAE